jgi:hypothetical protein
MKKGTFVFVIVMAFFGFLAIYFSTPGVVERHSGQRYIITWGDSIFEMGNIADTYEYEILSNGCIRFKTQNSLGRYIEKTVCEKYRIKVAQTEHGLL